MDESTRNKIRNIKERLMMKEPHCRNCSIVEERLRIKANAELMKEKEILELRDQIEALIKNK